MRMDKLTSKFQLALSDAQSMAVGRDHQFIEPVHLMSALLEQEGGTIRGLLSKASVDMNKLRSQLGAARYSTRYAGGGGRWAGTTTQAPSAAAATAPTVMRTNCFIDSSLERSSSPQLRNIVSATQPGFHAI